MSPREASAAARAARRGDAPGVVFTPPTLARRLLERLALLAPPGVPLLDPSCGDGALLAAAAPAFDPLHGIELRRALAERARIRVPDAHIRCGDALSVTAPAWPPGTWIAANPPWVSFSGRQAAPGAAPGDAPGDAPGAALGRRPRRRGWPSLHGQFLERIAQHVATERTGAAVLLPAALVELDGYAPLRERIGTWVRPVEVHELGERAFPGVVEPAIELLLLPNDAASPPASWSPRPAATPLEQRLAPFPRLPRKSFADPGVHTGNSASELVLTEGAPYPPIAQGRDLSPFRLGPARARLRTDLERSPQRRFRVAPREHYAAFPVLVRQTANRPIAALHEPRGYFRNTLLACREVEGLDPAFVVAVLNAAPAAAWHRASFADARQRTFPQVKVKHLGTQPFPIVHRDQDPRLHDELAARVRALEGAATNFEDEAARIDERVTRAFGLVGSARALLEP